MSIVFIIFTSKISPPFQWLYVRCSDEFFLDEPYEPPRKKCQVSLGAPTLAETIKNLTKPIFKLNTIKMLKIIDISRDQN